MYFYNYVKSLYVYFGRSVRDVFSFKRPVVYKLLALPVSSHTDTTWPLCSLYFGCDTILGKDKRYHSR